MNHTQRLLFWSMAALTVLRWALAGLHDITPAEAHLVEWSRHPSLAGVEGGALPAWFAALGTAVFGKVPFGVRFLAPLFIAGASWLLYRLSRSLSGEKTAAWAVTLFNVMPLTNLAAVQMRPETAGIFFFIAGMTAVWRGLRRASPWDFHWPVAGMLHGAAFLCWYGAAWSMPCAFLLIIGSRRWRGLLFRPGPWLMLADFLLFAWPLADWNHASALAGWHALHDELWPAGRGLQWMAPLALTGQWLAAVSPVMFAAMLWALHRAAAVWRTDDTARFAAAHALPPLLFALPACLAAGARAAWIAPALPALCLLLPWAWENKLQNLRLKQHLQWLCVLPALVLTPVALDTDLVRHAGVPWSYERDPSRHTRGWRATAEEVTAAVNDALPQAPNGLFLIARDERLASILNFHLPPELPVLRPTARHPLVHVVESAVPENDYHFWPHYSDSVGELSAFRGRTALYFSDDASARPPARIRDAFRSVTVVAVFDVLQGGLPVRRVKVFACHEYRGLPL